MSAIAPPAVVPLYSAVYTLERSTLFWLCLRLGALRTAVLLFWCLGLWLACVLTAMPEFTWSMFLLVAGYQATWWWGLIFLLVLSMLPVIAFLKSRRQKALGVPVVYAFDERGMHVSCALFESRMLWEYFLGRRELSDFFVLHDGTRQVLWPKDVFSDEAVDRFRALTEPLTHK